MSISTIATALLALVPFPPPVMVLEEDADVDELIVANVVILIN